jgi:serine/threonine protein kinase
MIGEVIGNYRVLEKIGDGGMGQVFRGEEIFLGRDVAIKALRPELTQDPGMLERFQQEAKTLSKLQHPNIVVLYTFFQHEGRYFMVMEFAHGETVATIMHRYPAGVAWRQAVTWIIQVLAALEYAHSQGVVHRDIKPANLMVQTNRIVKVMDFGVARILGSSKLTRTGFMAGTIKYMSPEQIQSMELDGRSDIYSTGLVLYEMLCGQPPFDHPNEYSLIRAQVEEPPPPLLQRLPDLPPKLEALILRALSKRPQDRFGSAWEFQQLLESVIREDNPWDESTRLIWTGADDHRRAASREMPTPKFSEVTLPPSNRPPSSGFSPPHRLSRETESPSRMTQTLITGDEAIPKPRHKLLWPSLGAGVLIAIGAAMLVLRKDQEIPMPTQVDTPEIAKSQPTSAVEPSKDQLEAESIRTEVIALRKSIDETQKLLREQALNAAQDLERVVQLLDAARSAEVRRRLTVSKLEAEHQFARLTAVEAKFREQLLGSQGLRILDDLFDKASLALGTGDISKAKPSFQEAGDGLRRLQEYPSTVREELDQAEIVTIQRLEGRWGDKTCTSPSIWQIKDHRITVSWPGQEPAEARFLAIKDQRDIYAVIESPAVYQGEIYRYRSSGNELHVENVSDGRAKILKRC